MQNNNQKETPSWIFFSFYASLVFGIVYIIFQHGFLLSQNDFAYRRAYHDYSKKINPLYIEPVISIVPKRTPDAIKNGEGNFSKVCVACHGEYGKYKAGLTGVDLSDGNWLHYNNEQKIAKLIVGGVNASMSKTKQIMAPRGGSGYTDKQIWEIVYYLSSKNKSIIQDAKPTE